MVDHDLLDAFNDCIDRLAAGQSVDDCLRSYPQYEPALRPMLEAGLLARRVRFSQTEVRQAQTRVRARVQQAIRAAPPPRQYQFQWARMVASLLLVFAFAAGGLGLAAENSLPGDALYSVKLFSESVRLGLSSDSATLKAAFDQRRLDETQELVSLKREAEVTFEAAITAIEGSRWTISGLVVRVESSVPGSDNRLPGDRIRVRAVTTTQGEIVGLNIEVGQRTQIPPPLTPTIAPTATATPTATFTQPATDTPPPTFTPSATITDTPILSVTVRRETATPECRPQRPEGWVEYAIQRGDSLSALAVRAGVSLERLLAVNCLSADRTLLVGQRIYLPRRLSDATPQATRQDSEAGRNPAPTTTPESSRPRG